MKFRNHQKKKKPKRIRKARNWAELVEQLCQVAEAEGARTRFY